MQIRNETGDIQDADAQIMAISYADVVFRMFRAGMTFFGGQRVAAATSKVPESASREA